MVAAILSIALIAGAVILGLCFLFAIISLTWIAIKSSLPISSALQIEKVMIARRNALLRSATTELQRGHSIKEEPSKDIVGRRIDAEVRVSDVSSNGLVYSVATGSSDSRSPIVIFKLPVEQAISLSRGSLVVIVGTVDRVELDEMESYDRCTITLVDAKF